MSEYLNGVLHLMMFSYNVWGLRWWNLKFHFSEGGFIIPCTFTWFFYWRRIFVHCLNSYREIWVVELVIDYSFKSSLIRKHRCSTYLIQNQYRTNYELLKYVIAHLHCISLIKNSMCIYQLNVKYITWIISWSWLNWALYTFPQQKKNVVRFYYAKR